MGSSKVVNTSPVPHTMEDKKTIKSILTKTIKVLAPWKGHNFQAKKKEKEVKKETKEEITKYVVREKIDVEKLIVENFNKLQIEKEREYENVVEEDDDKLFSYNIVKDDDDLSFADDKKTERTDSHISADSGFSEKDCDGPETVKVDAKDAKSESDKEEKDLRKEENKSRVRSNSVGVGKNAKSNSDKLTSNKEEKISERVRTQSEKSVISKGEEEVINSLSKLKIEDGKKKKLHTVAVSRGPILNKRDYAAVSHPYSYDAQGNFKQINQINTKTFSGGQVIYNTPRLDDYTEVCDALNSVQRNVQDFPKNPEQQEAYLQLAVDFIAKDTNYSMNEDVTQESLLNEVIQTLDGVPEGNFNLNAVTERNPLEEFQNLQEFQNQNYAVDENCMRINEPQNSQLLTAVSESNPIEEFHEHEIFQHLIDYTDLDAELMGTNQIQTDQIQNGHIFPTPPRSENVPSPDSVSSYYPSHSEYTPSPAMSSPLSNDYEKFQDISQYGDQMIPSCVSEHVDEVTEKKEKARERNASTSSSSASSMSMKQYKDLQKELTMGFSKKECCQATRKSTKEIFCEHAQRLKIEVRKNITLNVASMNAKDCYGVLQNILLKLQSASEQVDLHIVLFRQICDRLLKEKPAIFVGETGLNLLLAAALRCPTTPLLTRYLVECVRVALSQDPSLVPGEYVFGDKASQDERGNTLLICCARLGDRFADVLYELVNKKADEKPLFNVDHSNAEGNSALHVACKHHSATNTCLHVSHVLLEHAGADLWKGNITGGDTALHLAVNSATCDLNMIMVLFKHEDRKMWRKLAHVPNRRYDATTRRSSITPLDYARCATKSRQDYPKEVSEFLKKCR